jgi:pimeloyl-ACP methyl ester carboxylesterase
MRTPRSTRPRSSASCSWTPSCPASANWKNVWLLRDLWHFHFHGTTPLALVKGRERTYFEHFWNDFAADPKHSVPEADRQFYAKAYAQPDGMRAGFEYFKAFERTLRSSPNWQDAAAHADAGADSGEKAGGSFLIEQGKLVATNVEGVIVKGSGHWLMEEAPEQVIPALVKFLG